MDITTFFRLFWSTIFGTLYYLANRQKYLGDFKKYAKNRLSQDRPRDVVYIRERLFYVLLVYLKALEQFTDGRDVILLGHMVGQFGRLYTAVNRQNGKENFEFSKCVPEVFLWSENGF